MRQKNSILHLHLLLLAGVFFAAILPLHCSFSAPAFHFDSYFFQMTELRSKSPSFFRQHREKLFAALQVGAPPTCLDGADVSGQGYGRAEKGALAFRAKNPLPTSLANLNRQDKKRENTTHNRFATVKESVPFAPSRLQTNLTFPATFPPTKIKTPGKRPDDPRPSPAFQFG